MRGLLRLPNVIGANARPDYTNTPSRIGRV